MKDRSDAELIAEAERRKARMTLCGFPSESEDLAIELASRLKAANERLEHVEGLFRDYNEVCFRGERNCLSNDRETELRMFLGDDYK